MKTVREQIRRNFFLYESTWEIVRRSPTYIQAYNEFSEKAEEAASQGSLDRLIEEFITNFNIFPFDPASPFEKIFEVWFRRELEKPSWRPPWFERLYFKGLFPLYRHPSHPDSKLLIPFEPIERRPSIYVVLDHVAGFLQDERIGGGKKDLPPFTEAPTVVKIVGSPPEGPSRCLCLSINRSAKAEDILRETKVVLKYLGFPDELRGLSPATFWRRLRVFDLRTGRIMPPRFLHQKLLKLTRKAQRGEVASSELSELIKTPRPTFEEIGLWMASDKWSGYESGKDLSDLAKLAQADFQSIAALIGYVSDEPSGKADLLSTAISSSSFEEEEGLERRSIGYYQRMLEEKSEKQAEQSLFDQEVLEVTRLIRR